MEALIFCFGGNSIVTGKKTCVKNFIKHGKKLALINLNVTSSFALMLSLSSSEFFE